MPSQVIWIVAVVMEGSLVIRSFLAGLIRNYPYFYSYICFVFVQDLLRMLVYAERREIYPQVYWATQFLGLFFGCGLLWEIYRNALTPFPGAKRIARYMFGILIAALVVKATLGTGSWTSSQAILTTLDIERDLRFVQAISLAALVSVFSFYKVPLGRNLRSLVLGYGIFLATSVVSLAVRAQLGEQFQLAWQLLQPSFYVLVLAVWSFGMWRYLPMETHKNTSKIVEGYKRLAYSTRVRLGELRSRVNKGIRA
ncbi:MAG: hypothetical protein JSS69_18090 [Acidobacteria bacterium]|nr:hypothetical protein [Acidobacteriota bacterium]